MRKPTPAQMLSAAISLCDAPRNTVNPQSYWSLSYLPWAEDTQTDETAICFRGKFFILNGDHREQLNGKSIHSALQYWRSNPEQWGFTTDKLEAES